MGINFLDDAWLHVVAHVLPEEIFVVRGVFPSEFVWSILIVVGTKVRKQGWSHLGVIFSWHHTWEKH